MDFSKLTTKKRGRKNGTENTHYTMVVPQDERKATMVELRKVVGDILGTGDNNSDTLLHSMLTVERVARELGVKTGGIDAIVKALGSTKKSTTRQVVDVSEKKPTPVTVA